MGSGLEWHRKLTASACRHPWHFLAGAALLTAISAWAASELPIFTSRKALLPPETPVLKRLDNFLERFGSASDLIVVVEGAPRPELEAFASDLAERLRHKPLIGGAQERLDTSFFYEHAYLLIPPKNLGQVRSVLAQIEDQPILTDSPNAAEALRRVEKWLDDPPPLSSIDIDVQTGADASRLFLFVLDEWLRWTNSPALPKEIAWKDLVQQQQAEGFIAGHGYFASRDGRMLFVFVRQSEPTEEFKVLDPFIREVRATASALVAEYAAQGRPAPKFGLTGLPATVHEEYLAIQKDILLTVSTAGVLVLLVILVGMRSWRRALVIFIPMGLGSLWNAGLTLWTVGHMTMITAGFTAILFGVGVDYGIFVSSRILEEIEKGSSLFDAIVEGTAGSARAIFTCGGATILIFGALSTVEFTGFSELGIVAGTGVLTVLLATFLVLPALFVLLRPRPPKPVARTFPLAEAPTVRRRSKALAVALLVPVILACGIGAYAGLSIPFDYDVLNLLPKDSEGAFYQRRMVAESDIQGEAVVLQARTLEEARRMTAEAAKKRTLARVESIVDLFPPDMEDRVRIAREIGASAEKAPLARRILEDRRVEVSAESMAAVRVCLQKAISLLEDIQEQAFSAGHGDMVDVIEKVRGRMKALSKSLAENPEKGRVASEDYLATLMAAARSGLEVITRWKEARPITPDQLPPSIRDRFFGKDGSVAMYAFPSHSIYDIAFLDRLMADVYQVSPEATGFPTTHQVFSRTAVQSFKQGTILAGIVALVWILLTVRSFWGFMLAALPLVIGQGWMLGILAFLEIPYNYANMIALPMVMALAVDYGVWFAHRWREYQDKPPLRIAFIAGRAILLAFLTTLAGLGAITLASYQGVATMGISITIGLGCCVLAALFVGPLIAGLRNGRKS